jgi:hypothetical protein
MRDLLVVVPSRARPRSVERLRDAMDATCRGDTHLLVGLDEDDPQRGEYPEGVEYEVRPDLRGVVAWMNFLAVLHVDDYRFIGSIGDDNEPKTAGWDVQIMEALGKTPFAFANDLYPRPAGSLCCHIFCRSEVVKTLGYFAVPALQHMYCDPAWMAWGEATGITYLHDVIVEHLHYSVGKSPVDESYRTSNAKTTADLIAYNHYCEDPGPEGLNADIRKLQGIEWSPERIRQFNDDLFIPPLRG